jgi:hypothetical protein
MACATAPDDTRPLPIVIVQIGRHHPLRPPKLRVPRRDVHWPAT